MLLLFKGKTFQAFDCTGNDNQTEPIEYNQTTHNIEKTQK